MTSNSVLPCFLDSQSADVFFLVEGEKVPAHRQFLSSSCPYFQTMLCGATNEARMREIPLHDTPLKQFIELLRFCYCNQIAIKRWDGSDVVRLLLLAHEYQHEELVKVLCQNMDRFMLVESIGEISSVALMCGFKDLYEKCFRFVKANKDKVLASEGFANFSTQFLEDLLERCVFQGEPLVNFVRALSRWKSSHSSEDMRRVLNKARWDGISRTDFRQMVTVLVNRI